MYSFQLLNNLIIGKGRIGFNFIKKRKIIYKNINSFFYKIKNYNNYVNNYGKKFKQKMLKKRDRKYIKTSFYIINFFGFNLKKKKKRKNRIKEFYPYLNYIK